MATLRAVSWHRSRVLRIVLAAAFLFVGAGQVLHAMETVHVACAEHDQVHDVSRAKVSGPATVTSTTTPEQAHAHCSVGVLSRAPHVELVALPAPSTSPPGPSCPVADSIFGLTILRYAPSNSPPHVV